MSAEHFIGNFLNSFAQTKFAGEEAARRKKEAKLTGQLVELQLQGIQKKNTARSMIDEMLNPQPQNFMLENIQGPGQEDIGSLTKRPEFGGLVDMLAGGQEPLLADAGLLDTAASMSRAEPDILRIGEALDMSKEEMKELAFAGNKSPLLEFLKLRAGEQDVEAGALDLQQAQDELAKIPRRFNVGMREDLRTAKDIAKLLQRLQGTLLEPGLPLSRQIKESGMSVAAFLGRNGGINVPDEILSASQKLGKKLEDDVLRAMLAIPGVDNIPTFQTLQASRPNQEMNDDVIMELVGDSLRQSLNLAEIDGYEVANRDEVEEFIRQIEAGEILQQTKPLVDLPKIAGKAVETVEDIAQMTKQELEELSQYAEALPDNLRKAARERWNELNAE